MAEWVGGQRSVCPEVLGVRGSQGDPRLLTPDRGYYQFPKRGTPPGPSLSPGHTSFSVDRGHKILACEAQPSLRPCRMTGEGTVQIQGEIWIFFF